MTQPQPGQQSTPPPGPSPVTVVMGPQPRTPATPTGTRPRTTRRPWWTSHPPSLALAALILILAELGLYTWLHLTGWLLANALVAVVAAVLVVAWVQGGHKLFRRTHRTRESAARTTGGGFGPLGLRVPRPVGTHPSGAPGPGGTRRPGLLGRLGLRGGAPTGPGATLGAPRGHRSPSGAGGSTPGGAGHPRRAWPFGGSKPHGSAGHNQPGTTRHPRRHPSVGARVGAATNWVRRNVEAARNAAKPAKPAATPAPAGSPTKSAQQPSSRPPAQPATQPAPPATAAPAQPVPAVKHAPAGRPTMTEPTRPAQTLRPRDDTSLQAWGRALPAVEAAIRESATHADQEAQATRSAAEALTRIASQAEDGTLPAARPLAAEIAAQAAELRRIAAEREALVIQERRLADRAAGLPGLYRREHETDEDRVNSPRVSHEAEKRADVHRAQQDT